MTKHIRCEIKLARQSRLTGQALVCMVQQSELYHDLVIEFLQLACKIAGRTAVGEFAHEGRRIYVSDHDQHCSYSPGIGRRKVRKIDVLEAPKSDLQSFSLPNKKAIIYGEGTRPRYQFLQHRMCMQAMDAHAQELADPRLPAVRYAQNSIVMVLIRRRSDSDENCNDRTNTLHPRGRVLMAPIQKLGEPADGEPKSCPSAKTNPLYQRALANKFFDSNTLSRYRGEL